MQQQLQYSIDQSSLEIRKATRQLSDIIYRVNQQSLAVEAASESFRIVQNRYGQGLINTTDVLMAQTQTSQQKMLYAQAIFTKKTIITYLNFLTTAK